MTVECPHGGTPGACFECYRDQQAAMADGSDLGTAEDSGPLALRARGQSWFISPIESENNWKITKEEGLWGTQLRSSKLASEVRADDLIVAWEPKGGIKAIVRAVSLSQRPRTLDEVPWPDPELYIYMFPIEVLVELDDPLADDFTSRDRVSARFHLKNAQVQTGFRRLEREQMALIVAAVKAVNATA